MTSDVPTESINSDAPDEPLRRDLERDPGADEEAPDLEETSVYERAVEEDTPLRAGDEDPGQGELAPEFTEPGER